MLFRDPNGRNKRIFKHGYVVKFNLLSFKADDGILPNFRCFPVHLFALTFNCPAQYYH